MEHIHTDPNTGRQYVYDDVTGQSRWLEAPPAPAPTAYGSSGTEYPSYPNGQQPFGQPYQQAPVAAASQPPKKKRTGRKIALGIVGVFVVLIAISSLNSKDSTTTTTTTGATGQASTAGAKSGSQAAKVGTPVRDGKFEFTVTNFKTQQKIGDQYVNKTAQGQFVLMNVTVKNIGDQAQLFDSSAQKLFDPSGKEYSADGGAVMYLGDKAKSFLEQINPGNSVNAIVVFDVPKGTKVSKVELHDSLFSGGVDVAVS